MPSKKKSDKVADNKPDLSVMTDQEIREYEQQQRIKDINNEVRRLTAIFKDIELSSAKQRIIKGLIDEAAFMFATIKGLKQTINLVGPIDEMPQGEYSILRQHPAVQTYNSMIQRYTTVYKELLNLLPPEKEKTETDGFEEFVNGK